MILNIILVILFVKLFFEYKLKLKSYPTLNCGVFGFYGKNSRKFDWLKFDILGVDNDKRGGDACGRIVGNSVEHSNILNKRKYADYINAYLPPKTKLKDKLVIGHTRKASYGRKKDEIQYTQPLPFYNQEGGIDFVFAHNGTLYNHEELAKEYKINNEEFLYYNKDGDLEPTSGAMNDSQILGWILGYKKDFDVLKKYKGGAAFALYDYREDLFYLWSGASLRSGGKIPAEERPMNILKGKDHLWFSSLDDSLFFINYSEEDEVEELENNVLYIYKDGVEVDRKFIDRSQSYQYNKVEYTPSSSTTRQLPAVNNSPRANRDEFIECRICNTTGLLQGNYECFHCDGMGYVRHYNEPKKNINLKDLTCAYSNNSNTNPFGEDLPSDSEMLIKFARGRYFYKGKECHGIYHINEIGMITSKPTIKYNEDDTWYNTKPYYFIKGIMMDNHEAFNKFSGKIKAKTTISLQDCIDLRRNAQHPVFNIKNGSVIKGVWDNQNHWAYSGEFLPLFSHYVYTVDKGMFTSRNREATQARPRHIYNKEYDQTIEDVDIIPEGDNKKIPEMNCVFCDGTGVDQDEEICICQEEKVSDFQTTEDQFYDEQIKKELSEELASLLHKAHDVRSSTFVYHGHKVVQQVDEVLGDIIQVLEDVKL